MILTKRFGMYVTTLLVASGPLMAATAQAPSGSSPATFDRSACVLDAGDSVIFSEPGSNEVYELRGKKSAPFKNDIGKRTRVVGEIDTTATPTPGAVKAAKGGTVRVVTVAGLKADKDPGAAGCHDLATALGASAVAGAGAAAAAGAASAASVAAAAGAATAAGIAVPAAAAMSTAAIAGVAVAGAAAAGVGGAAATGALGGSTTSP
jgi:hypothetical protein